MLPLVLIADGDPVRGVGLASVVRDFGCQPIVATDGPSAIHCCQTSQPALVILDHAIGDGDVFEICRRIRTLSDAALPVVLLTGHRDSIDSIIPIEAGFDYLLEKPVSPHELTQLLSCLQSCRKQVWNHGALPAPTSLERRG